VLYDIIVKIEIDLDLDMLDFKNLQIFILGQCSVELCVQVN
jgi:hypothetical protein